MSTSLPRLLGERVGRAVADVTGQAIAVADVRPCADARFGDYQWNGALPLAKLRGERPRELAERVARALDVAEICEPPDVAGPGFVNLRLKTSWLGEALTAIPPAEPGSPFDRLGIAPVAAPETVVVDMSSPNLAKAMHVGHLRSTVIGESVARILQLAGHRVHKVNHVGDWGTQFGMLLARLRRLEPALLADPTSLAIGDLEAFYVDAKRAFDADPAFADEARRTVVSLQAGDPETLRIWDAFCRESLRHCHAIYRGLGIDGLVDRGESAYNDELAGVLDELRRLGLAVESEGAECIFLDGFATREGTPQPLLVRKSDGGYNYATTDLAAIRHRLREMAATRVVYVVGAPQKRHFEMVFAAVRKAGWAKPDVRLEHLAFGSMLGDDGRPFRTRDGGTIKLKDLLDEAVTRARVVVDAGQTDAGDERRLDEAERARVAQTVGIAAVRYFDLLHSLTSDYRFDWETMLSLDGNTAPYMLYAYARIRSIGRKAGVDLDRLPAETQVLPEHESELALARALVRFPEIVEQLARDLMPHVLTEYLFGLAKAFSRFYDRRLGVRVIDAEPEAVRGSRLRLADLTARTLRTGLWLLGIEPLEQM